MSEHDDLRNLVMSPGWLMLVERARQEWRVGYPEKIKLAIQTAKADHSDLSAAVASIDFASDAINALVSWPTERLKQLEFATEREHVTNWPSRRGSL